MNENILNGKKILITGGARRVGRMFAIACAKAGAEVIIHHGHSDDEAKLLEEEIASFNGKASSLRADLSNPAETSALVARASEHSPLYALINSASIFEPLNWDSTSLNDWQRHMDINLTAPFFLSQAFAKQILSSPEGGVPAAEDGGKSIVSGRIVNILDWIALRPRADHFPYTISKAALAALTKSLAVALAPRITVNALALGAILPPADGADYNHIVKNVPMKRWVAENEIEDALIFLLTAPTYITGEILHVDGGRHLV